MTGEAPTPPGYLRHYSATGQPVVLVGEILSGHAAWSAHADRLVGRWRVIAVSPLVVVSAAAGERPPHGWGVPMETDALAQSLDALGLPDFHLVGWSLGGAIALDFALNAPHRVRSLTLVEPQVRWVMRGLGRQTPADAEDERYVRSLATSGIDEPTLAGFLHWAGAVPRDQDPRQHRAWRLAWANRVALASAWRVQAHEDSLARLARLTMPMLLVRGDATTGADARMTDALGELLPQARWLVLAGGHSSHLLDPDGFAVALEATLRDGEARRF